MRRGGPGGLERYMEHLKNTNPEDFEAFNKLREEDPEAFKHQLMERLQHMRKGVENIPPERREEMRKRFMGRREGGGGFRGPPMDPEEMGKRRAQYEQFKGKVDGLKKAYHHTEDDEERQRIRDEITGHIGEMFEARQAERKRHIDRFREELERMEAQMAEDDAKRDEHVSARVNEILRK